MKAEERVEDMVVIGRRLAELLDKENAALRQRRTADVSALVDEKSKLSRAFESRFKGLAEHPEELAKVGSELRQRLAGVGRTVEARAEENARLLRVALAAHDKVIQVIAEAVKSAQPGPRTYAPPRRGRIKTASATPPISVDQAL